MSVCTSVPAAPALAAKVVATGDDRATRRLRVMQVTDWLDPGGKERVAINVANLLPRDRYESFLCTTRASGPLERLVAPHVRCIHLARPHRFAWKPIRRLIAFNADHRIDVLHAHGSSVFVAIAASLFPPYPKVVWHDHYGPYRSDDRPVGLYRMAAQRIAAVIAVNRPLVEWARHRLRVPGDRVWYIPNFVCQPDSSPAVEELPGAPGRRIVCVAHLRPQKDHLTLLRAFASVRAAVPDAHLILVGGAGVPAYQSRIDGVMTDLDLRAGVSWLGQREHVEAILRQCDIGVLSSASEGFPLALVEYGEAGLATVATSVGECPEVLGNGEAGLLVPPSETGPLADALVRLLTDERRRRALGSALQKRVRTLYRPGTIIERVCRVYQTVVTAEVAQRARP